jgi:nicotinamide mononucleotide adenylyltransferase
MLRNEPWQHLVPQAAIEVIEQIDGVNRLKEVSREDKTSDLGTL